MRPSSAKAKGRRFQQEVVAALVAAFGWHPDDAKSTSMGAGGCDIHLSRAAQRDFPFAIECKNVEALNIWGAFLQAIEHARKTGRKPALFIRRNKQEPLVVLTMTDFLAREAQRSVL